ncbi:MAG: PH domain-containing protein [Oscillospiraceae bacterium]|jgi:uncharacterized membrane protein YdbT with pleckstrin-like domain|nr:PH domain-containing protein [Oscillospiraceae bacterium]
MASEQELHELEVQEKQERIQREKERHREIWADRKRTFFGLPWSFTRYNLSGEKLIIETGLFSRHSEVIRLYRIKDISLDRSFGERLFGLGTISCVSSDATAHNFKIQRVKCSVEVANALSDLVEQLRRDMRVSMREMMVDHEEHDDNDSLDYLETH